MKNQNQIKNCVNLHPTKEEKYTLKMGDLLSYKWRVPHRSNDNI